MTSRSSAHARSTDPAPAHQAAEVITPHVSALEAEVLATMRAIGHPCTTHEISARSGIDLVSVSPRMARLRERGLVRDAGMQARPGKPPRTLWRVVEPPREGSAA